MNIIELHSKIKATRKSIEQSYDKFRDDLYTLADLYLTAVNSGEGEYKTRLLLIDSLENFIIYINHVTEEDFRLYKDDNGKYHIA